MEPGALGYRLIAPPTGYHPCHTWAGVGRRCHSLLTGFEPLAAAKCPCSTSLTPVPPPPHQAFCRHSWFAHMPRANHGISSLQITPPPCFFYLLCFSTILEAREVAVKGGRESKHLAEDTDSPYFIVSYLREAALRHLGRWGPACAQLSMQS